MWLVCGGKWTSVLVSVNIALAEILHLQRSEKGFQIPNQAQITSHINFYWEWMSLTNPVSITFFSFLSETFEEMRGVWGRQAPLSIRTITELIDPSTTLTRYSISIWFYKMQIFIQTIDHFWLVLKMRIQSITHWSSDTGLWFLCENVQWRLTLRFIKKIFAKQKKR